MSFDPNPMSPIEHLKQIEREVEQHCTYQRTAEEPNQQLNEQAVTFKSWIARLADVLAMPRTAS